MTFKRHYHEHGLTEAEYDYLLPVPDPITILSDPPSSKPNQKTRTITKETQNGTTYQTPASLAKVFGVLELAEKILLQLPPENLLCKVQMVCRKWHEIVRDSDHIQEYLFFKPVKARKRLFGAVENPWLYLFSTIVSRTEGSWERMFMTQPPLVPLSHIALGDNDERLQREASVGRLMLQYLVAGLATPSQWSESNVGGDMLESTGMKLEPIYSVQLWHYWKPLVGWEMINNLKKDPKWGENFLESVLADEEHFGENPMSFNLGIS